MQHTQMKPETESKVVELARINYDSARGFLKAAEVTTDAMLESTFKKYAAERAQFADELKHAVGSEAAQKADTGSIKAQVHRWWMDVRGLMSGEGEYAVLAEAERGEDQIKAAYEEVILETVGSPVSDVLHAQLGRVKAGHDRIRALRDAAKS